MIRLRERRQTGAWQEWARAWRGCVRAFGLEVRAGLHTGEVELLDSELLLGRLSPWPVLVGEPTTSN